jgi:transcriptional regulator with XRE-family HTH domain
MDYFGQEIKALLKEKDWNQKILALSLGKSPQYVNNLYHNRTKASLDIMQRIASCAGMTLEDLRALQRRHDEHADQTAHPSLGASRDLKCAITKQLLDRRASPEVIVDVLNAF